MLNIPLVKSAHRNLDELLASKPQAKLAVAVSGGADSMALVLILQSWCKKHKVELHALTVDHHLREDSTKESEQIAQWLTKLNVSHHILDWQHEGKPTGNIQSLAREARYELMAEYCLENGIDYLALGHHLDDQAETVLQRLERGSGVDGLRGMQPITLKNGIYLLRPLLDVTKDVLINFLKSQKQKWIEDPSNQDTKYQRNHLRQLLSELPNSENLTERLGQTAKHCQRVCSYLDEKIKDDIAQSCSLHIEGHISITKQHFAPLHEEAKLRILTHALTFMGNTIYKPRFDELENLLNTIQKKGFKAATLNGCVIREYKKGYWLIYRELKHIPSDTPIDATAPLLWDGKYWCGVITTFPGLKVGALNPEGLRYIKEDNKKLYKKITAHGINDILHTIPAFKISDKPIAVPMLNYFEHEPFRDGMKLGIHDNIFINAETKWLNST